MSLYGVPLVVEDKGEYAACVKTASGSTLTVAAQIMDAAEFSTLLPRIVACVNACAALTDGQLQQVVDGKAELVLGKRYKCREVENVAGDPVLPRTSVPWNPPVPDTTDDRELDALVATKVMGWTHIETQTFEDTAVWFGFPPQPDGKPFNRDGLHGIPEFSTWIAAAWQVMERMMDRGIYVIFSADAADSFEVTFGSRRESRRYEVVGESLGGKAAPRAICMAALAAIEAEASGKWITNHQETA